MPNRIIKESICTSDNIENLKLEEEVFFYRLLVNCDDYGRMDARPQILRAKCFPLRTDKIKPGDINKWLASLARENLIIIYHADGGEYIQMITWDKHQRIRAKRSKFPEFDGDVDNLLSSDGQVPADDNICVRNPIQSNPIRIQSESELTNPELEFDGWWDKYPRKRGKEGALKSWIKLRKDGVSEEQLIKALKNYLLEIKSKKIEEKYILHGSTFLGKEKPWKDFLQEVIEVEPDQKPDDGIDEFIIQ